MPERVIETMYAVAAETMYAMRPCMPERRVTGYGLVNRLVTVYARLRIIETVYAKAVRVCSCSNHVETVYAVAVETVYAVAAHSSSHHSSSHHSSSHHDTSKSSKASGTSEHSHSSSTKSRKYVTIDCDSWNFEYQVCNVPGAKSINNVRLTEQRSKSECKLNSSFGFDGDHIWVNKGCRGRFNVCYHS
ncbi:hypothetical protein DPMN_058348 [Dreissena polymorpha]|uniref:DUF3011 domain-containing protein n=1 Tax=Dreissena polymorpha TaxID=45954 RepID=A0A9D4C1V6_DREPO|nr:hypothetical protein DPMN_058348 [Dreissena polymorpha]